MALYLSDLIAAFEQWAEGNLRSSTRREYQRQFNRFIASYGDVNLDDVKPHHLLRWGKTWHKIQAMQRLFNWGAEEAQLIERNPFKRVKRPATGQRRRVLTRRECVLLRRDACWQFRDYLLALQETLARPQEVKALCWEHLTWQGKPQKMQQSLSEGKGLFVLERYKARERTADPNRPRIILVSPRLGRLLCRLARGRAELAGRVFRNTRGGAWTTNALRLQMRRGRDRLKLGTDHRGEKVVCYSFRHTMATLASSKGVKDRLLAEIMGHTSTRTTARYQHLDVEHLTEALRRVHFRA